MQLSVFACRPQNRWLPDLKQPLRQRAGVRTSPKSSPARGEIPIWTKRTLGNFGAGVEISRGQPLTESANEGLTRVSDYVVSGIASGTKSTISPACTSHRIKSRPTNLY